MQGPHASGKKFMKFQQGQWMMVYARQDAVSTIFFEEVPFAMCSCDSDMLETRGPIRGDAECALHCYAGFGHRPLFEPPPNQGDTIRHTL